MANINILAVIVSAIATMVLGSIWYHPRVLGATWMHLIGKNRDQLRNAQKAMYMAVIPAIIMPIAIGILFNAAEISTQTGAIGMALLLWVVVLTATSGEFIFENRPHKLWTINSGYQLVNLLIVCYIMALWK